MSLKMLNKAERRFITLINFNMLTLKVDGFTTPIQKYVTSLSKTLQKRLNKKKLSSKSVDQ